MPSTLAWDENAEAASKALGCRTVKTLSGSVLPKKEMLKSRFQIGSIKAEVDYGPSQRVFHVTQVPPAALARKKAVKRASCPDKLGLRQPGWNITAADPEPLCLRRQRQNRAYDRDMFKFNYRCEVLPTGEASRRDVYGKFGPTAPGARGAAARAARAAAAAPDTRVALGHTKRVAEMPVHPALDDKHAWDAGTTLLPPNHATTVMLSARREAARKRNSARKGARCVAAGRRPSLRARFADDMEALRVKRREALAIAEGRSRRPATAHSPARNRFAVEPDRRRQVTAHSGVWEFREAAGCHVWSDTMSEAKESRGDVVTVVNPDRWNNPQLTTAT
eukprot:g4463.t1